MEPSAWRSRIEGLKRENAGGMLFSSTEWARPACVSTQTTRFNLQVRQLAVAQPDVILLQEVNPLALNAEGLHYTEVHEAEG